MHDLRCGSAVSFSSTLCYTSSSVLTGIRIVDPKGIGYIGTLRLLKDARMVLTDSGGLQKEALWSGTPCMTIRNRTECIEILDRGVDLAGTNSNKIHQTVSTVEAGYDGIRERFRGNPFGDGNVAKRTTKILKEKGS